MNEDRLTVLKTHKLFIKGAFPRGESGRTHPLRDKHNGVLAQLCTASRKDLREAVEAAKGAQPAWAASTPYLRGQILYRLAEMIEGRAEEFTAALRETTDAGAKSARAEVDATIDRTICFAGWADKMVSILGNQNPVAAPYWNFTSPEPIGVLGIVAPDDSPLLGFVSLWLPALCAGNTVVVLASERCPLPALLMAESMPTSDVPAGVFNLLTGFREELLKPLGSHRDIDGVIAAVDNDHATVLRDQGADNLKRVRILNAKRDWTSETCDGPGAFHGSVEYKTTWHPLSAE
ncbi:MAG: aldehyde dehydrogenase family protein [Planctomycetes bacterium]|nr:aldehyde dehydrogenase family protein [Planctomycetota bacterium]